MQVSPKSASTIIYTSSAKQKYKITCCKKSIKNKKVLKFFYLVLIKLGGYICFYRLKAQ